MIKKNTLVMIALLLSIAATAQDRSIARGAEPGELYMVDCWYALYMEGSGYPHYKDLQYALFRMTENGKKLTIQYDVSMVYFDPETMVTPGGILVDATQGVVYMKNGIYKNGSDYTTLWVSFDYGENWMFREENQGFNSIFYYAANIEGIIYKYNRYGQGFFILDDVERLGNEPGLIDCEFFKWPGGHGVHHTYDCFQSYDDIIIDEEFMTADFPDIFRGGFSGEVYIGSWFYESANERIFKVSFSADTGHTFRHVYISEPFSPYFDFNKPKPIFMSDREPGVFYIIKNYMVEDLNDLNGWYLRPCISYYRDYGETLVATYCHDLTKDYGSTCEAVTDLVSEKCNNNCVMLTWSEPESSLPVEGYQVFRNEQLINNEQLIINNFYLDEDLPVGEYEYCVVTHYTTGCVSDTSNHVGETIELGIKEYESDFTVIPNPTTGQLTISPAGGGSRGWNNGQFSIDNVEVFDIYGKCHVSRVTYHNQHLPFTPRNLFCENNDRTGCCG